MNLFHSKNASKQLINKPGSEPASKENVLKQSYNLPGLTKNITVHSNGSHEKSSNYITMKNVINPPSESFYTIKPSISQHSNPPIPLEIQSNVIKEHLELPLSFGTNPYKNLPKPQFRLQDPVIMEEDHNYKFEYLEMKNSFNQLKETYDRLAMDYDILTKKMRLSQNNEQFLLKNNQDLASENGYLKNKLFELNQQLSTTRMHKESLQNQLQQLQNTKLSNLNQPNIKISIPQNIQSNQINNQSQLKNVFQPNFSHIEHQNRQLLYRIQEYESTILYKKIEIQQYKAEIDKQKAQNDRLRNQSNIKDTEITRLRRQIEVFTKKQIQFIQSEKDKTFYQSQASIIPSLKAEIQKQIRETVFLKRQNQTLNTQLEKLKQHIQHQNQPRQNLAETGMHQRNPPVNEMNVVQQISKVIKSYIGKDETTIQNDNQSFSKVNQALYNNLNQVLGPQSLPSRDQNRSQQNPTNESITKRVYEGLKSTLSGEKDPTKMKIQDEAFFDFQNEDGQTTELQNRQKNHYQSKNEENLPFQNRNKNQMSILEEIHSQLQHRNSSLYGFQLVKQRGPDDILSFPQLPFRGSKIVPHNDAKMNPVDVFMDKDKQSYQRQAKAKPFSHHSKIFTSTNGSYLKGQHPSRANEIQDINSFQQKLLQLADQNKRLKYALQNQQHKPFQHAF